MAVLPTGTHFMIGLDGAGTPQYVKTDNTGVLATNVTLGSLPAGTNNIGKVDVNSLPALPAGANAIGNVGVTVLPALPAGANAIGTVGVTSLPVLPAGSNAIGTVGVTSLPALPAGANALGSVSVTALPALPTGANTIGDVGVTSLPALPAGANAIGTVGVTSLPALPAGANALGSVTVTSLPALPAGANAIGTVTPLDALTFSGTATSQAVVTYTGLGPANGVIDTSGYGQISVQITGAGTGCTTTFQESNDNSTWTSVAAQNGANTAGGAATSTTSAGNFRIWPSARYFRLNVTTYGSGTVSATVCLRAYSAPPGNVGQGNGLSTATWGVAVNGKSSGGLTGSRIQSAATTNATSVKASAGQVYSIDVGNNGGTDAWLKLYNKASAPTVGSDTPFWTCYIPNGKARTFNLNIGIAMGTGIAYAITGGAGDSDTTAVAAGQVTGVLGYA